MAHSRQLRDHVEEQGDQRHEAEVQCRSGPVPLPRPLGEDESLRTLASNDGAQRSERQQRQGGGQRVDDDPLDAGQRSQLRIGEEDRGSQCCRG